MEDAWNVHDAMWSPCGINMDLALENREDEWEIS